VNTAIHSLPFNLKPHSLLNQSLPFIAKQHSLPNHSLYKFGVELLTLPTCGRRPNFGRYCTSLCISGQIQAFSVHSLPVQSLQFPGRRKKWLVIHSCLSRGDIHSLIIHSVNHSVSHSLSSVTPCLCGDFQALVRMHPLPDFRPGSMVAVVDEKQQGAPGGGAGLVVSGDTIFPGSCGRLDLPDADVERMFDSLAKCARVLPDAMIVYPGHNYNGATSTVAREKSGGLLKPFTKEQFMAMNAR